MIEWPLKNPQKIFIRLFLLHMRLVRPLDGLQKTEKKTALEDSV